MNDTRDDLALSFLTFSNQYLTLVENVARETVSQGNSWVIISDFVLEKGEYEKKTHWSDFSIIIPLLFNLFHGMELLLKGFILIDPLEDKKTKEHNIQSLCDCFKRKYPDQLILNSFFSKYTKRSLMPEILQQFLADNKLHIEKIYQELRYPSPPGNLTIRDYSSLKYRDKNGVLFFKDLADDIHLVLWESVKMYYCLEKK